MNWPEGGTPRPGSSPVPGGTPVPVGDLDARVLKDIHRLRWWSLLVVACLLLGGTVTLTIVVAHLNALLTRERSEIVASCHFYRDLSPLPVSDAPGSKYPSKVSVTLVHDARMTFLGQACAGGLPPPDPSFVRGAAHYGLNIPR